MAAEQATFQQLRRDFEILQPGIYVDSDFHWAPKRRHYKLLSQINAMQAHEAVVDPSKTGEQQFHVRDVTNSESFVLLARFCPHDAALTRLVQCIDKICTIDFSMRPLLCRQSETHVLEYFRIEHGHTVYHHLHQSSLARNPVVAAKVAEIVVFQILYIVKELHENDIYAARLPIQNFLIYPTPAATTELVYNNFLYRFPNQIDVWPTSVALARVTDLYRRWDIIPSDAIPSRWFIEISHGGISERDHLLTAMLNLARLTFNFQRPTIDRHLYEELLSQIDKVKNLDNSLSDANTGQVADDLLCTLFLLGYPTDPVLADRMSNNAIMYFFFKKRPHFTAHPQFDMLARVEHQRLPIASLVPLFRTALSWDTDHALANFDDALVHRPFRQFRNYI